MFAYFPLIDILRFLAAFGVMSFHFFSGSLPGNDPFSIYARYGYLGVELFFIISGFVIFFSVGKPFKDYAWGRFLRIYPLFWFLCTITYVATIVFPHVDHLSFLLYLKNLLIINDGKVATMIDGSYWTLTVELFFYAYIGIFTFFFGEKKLIYFFITWLLVSLITFSGGWQQLTITKILLVRYAPYFVFGGLLAYFYKHRAGLTKKIKYFIFAGIGLAALLPYYISAVLNNNPASTPTNHFGMFDRTGNAIVFSFFVLVPLSVYFSQKITKKSWLKVAKVVGGVTYPLYLIHNKLGGLIIGESYGRIASISVFTAGGMIIACIFISIYEEKFRKYLKKIIMTHYNKKNAEPEIVSSTESFPLSASALPKSLQPDLVSIEVGEEEK